MSEKNDVIKADRYIDFDIINENWNVYELEDKTIIKQKHIISLIFGTGEIDEKGKEKIGFAANDIIVVFSPKEIRGPPDKNYSIPELEKYIIVPNVKFSLIKDAEMNQYKTEKMNISVRTVVKRIEKTSKFDPKGMPQFIVRYESMLLIQEPEEEEEEEEENSTNKQ